MIMNYITDISFLGGITGTILFALIVLLQVIKGLSTAISSKIKMNNSSN